MLCVLVMYRSALEFFVTNTANLADEWRLERDFDQLSVAAMIRRFQTACVNFRNQTSLFGEGSADETLRKSVSRQIVGFQNAVTAELPRIDLEPGRIQDWTDRFHRVADSAEVFLEELETLLKQLAGYEGKKTQVHERLESDLKALHGIF